MDEATAPGFSWASRSDVRQLLLVTPDLLPQVWPQVEHLFLENASVWDTYYTLDTFPALFHEGKLQLWTMNDADEFLLVLITELRKFPKTTVINLLFVMGSDFKDGATLLDYVENWAYKQGATKSTILGRKGLLRLLAPNGYRQEAVVLSKNLYSIVEH